MPRAAVVGLLAGAEQIVPDGSPNEDELIHCALQAMLAEMFREDAGQ